MSLRTGRESIIEPRTHVYITSLGIISPLGRGVAETLAAITNNLGGIRPLSLFGTGTAPPLPVGEVGAAVPEGGLPRTHVLALIAAGEAMAKADAPPDAVVVGVTTGGMSLSEELIKRGEVKGRAYAYHSAGSVAECIARQVRCRGPALAVSTACSSGLAALAIALALIRAGRATRVLAGGADALCRLTYHGFHSLQLVDPKGTHPFDRDRRGMSVAEGAAFLYLTAAEIPPPQALAELLGTGLSCDAFHPAAPHPDGVGACRAMEKALADAGLAASEIDYINLHGTGTIDNDLAEAKALRALFQGRSLPPLSSLKGACGHPLAAAGATGAAVSVLSIAHGIIPANRGFHEPDLALALIPVAMPRQAVVKTALANAFGFGGNNAAAVFSHPRLKRKREMPRTAGPVSFTILGSACLTGAGDQDRTGERLWGDDGVRRPVPEGEIIGRLPAASIRRLKRLSRMVLSLALAAVQGAKDATPPAAIFLGTAWGGLSETYDFLTKLFSSQEQFSSPTDFVGSVHNAAAGQVAIHFKATGPNVTMTGGDCAFEQALFTASHLLHDSDGPLLVIGAEEHHEPLSALFDASVAQVGLPADGGGALFLRPAAGAAGRIFPAFLGFGEDPGPVIANLVCALGGAARINDRFGAVLAGLPAGQKDRAAGQLKQFLSETGFGGPVIDYRRHLGQYAAVSAVATVLGATFVESGEMPACSGFGRRMPLAGRGVLVLGFGTQISAVEIRP